MTIAAGSEIRGNYGSGTSVANTIGFDADAFETSGDVDRLLQSLQREAGGKPFDAMEDSDEAHAETVE